MDIKTAKRAGYVIGDKVNMVSATKRALLTPRWSARGLPGGGTSTARPGHLGHQDRAATCSSGAGTATTRSG